MIETRIYQLADGNREIVRILNDHVLGVWNPKKPLAFEKSIVWQQPIEELDFVRVAVIRNATSRRGPIVARGVGMAVGYSKLTEDAPRDPNTGFFTRRLFYLKEEDLLLNLNQIPSGGVIDPKTLLPGSEGQAPKTNDLNRGYPRWAWRPESPSAEAPVSV